MLSKYLQPLFTHVHNEHEFVPWQACLMFLSKVRAYQSGLSGAPQTSD